MLYRIFIYRIFYNIKEKIYLIHDNNITFIIIIQEKIIQEQIKVTEKELKF